MVAPDSWAKNCYLLTKNLEIHDFYDTLVAIID